MKKGELIGNILDAAEQLLIAEGLQKTTDRKIAAAAGVSEAIIHYYFRTKEGLLAALLDRLSSEVSAKITTALDQVTSESERPLRPIIQGLVDAYYAKPNLVAVMMAEMMHDSEVRRQFTARHGKEDITQIELAIRKLQAQNIYDAEVDARYFSLSMFSNVLAPLFLINLAGPNDIGLNRSDMRDEKWIDFLTEMFDRRLRSTPR